MPPPPPLPHPDHILLIVIDNEQNLVLEVRIHVGDQSKVGSVCTRKVGIMMIDVMVVSQKKMRSRTMARAFHSASMLACCVFFFILSTMWLRSSLICSSSECWEAEATEFSKEFSADFSTYFTSTFSRCEDVALRTSDCSEKTGTVYTVLRGTHTTYNNNFQ